ncbi:MAG: hypothetical protein F4Z55_17770, partial [Boseongicola sp. SB0667_bin_21]|nr:hypothetical protein [Boseongicola sp. SB0667_bin_21]
MGAAQQNRRSTARILRQACCARVTRSENGRTGATSRHAGQEEPNDDRRGEEASGDGAC